MNKILVGGDPEVFAVDKEGYCIPPYIFEKILGLKRVGTENPTDPDKHPFYIHNGDFTVMADGAAFELTFRPAETSEILKENYLRARSAAAEIITAFGLTFAPLPSVKFSLEYLAKKYGVDPDSEEIWMATHFGCDPQWNIYSSGYDQMVDAKTYPWRHGGGHVHFSVGGKNLHHNGKMFVQWCDTLLGTRSITSTRNLPLEKARQKFYGKPGNCRWQKYSEETFGIEYRTPSNTLWENGIDSIFPTVERILSTGNPPEEFILEVAKMAIESCDPKMCKNIIGEVYNEI